MIRIPAIILVISALVTPAFADAIYPVRTIRAKEVISAEDIEQRQATIAGTLTDPDEIIGWEARIALYPGRPIRNGDVVPPAIVNRNDVVPLIFTNGGLRIVTEGRALARGAAGETIRVMNLSSRTTVFGHIQPDGAIEVE